MRKFFNRLTIILATSSLALPLTACVYNFYVTSATNAVINSYANQTSAVIKALILGKEKKADTSQTIHDMFSDYSNTSIKDQTKNDNITSQEEFVTRWGYQGAINTSDFDLKDYFVTSGTNGLTQTVTTYRNINNVFNKLGLVSGLNIIDNKIVYNLIKGGNVRTTIENVLNGTKKDDPKEMDKTSIILKNLVLGSDWKNPDSASFTKKVTNPIASLLNNLVQGLWTNSDGTAVEVPKDTDEFKHFMINWKDSNGNPYSQWVDPDTDEWGLEDKFYENWKPVDFNFYRSGVLLNHLFHQIGIENKIKPIKNVTNNNDENTHADSDAGEPDYGRYLGNILGDHINLTDGIDDKLLPDLQQYLEYLTANPIYIINLIEAIVPLLKQWILEMPDSTKGVKNLTFGKAYPTDQEKNSYNIDEVLKRIQDLVANPDELFKIINDLIDNKVKNESEEETTNPGNSFAYDIGVKASILSPQPFPELIKLIKLVKPEEIEKLLQTIKNLLANPVIKATIDNIIDNIYNNWLKQYDDNGKGINFDLTKFQDFLLNETNGLLTIFNKDVVSVLTTIMTNPNPIKENEYFDFYKSLGGKTPEIGSHFPPVEFRENSVLEILKTNLSDTNAPFNQLVLILLGNSSSHNTGLLSFIVESNNQWIKDNYTNYFDLNNESSGRIYNQVMTTTTVGNEISNTLTYNFVYKINGTTYKFLISCKSANNKDDFTGTKNFYFTNIKKIK